MLNYFMVMIITDHNGNSFIFSQYFLGHRFEVAATTFGALANFVTNCFQITR